MTFWRALLDEALANHTLVVGGSLIATLGLVRSIAPAERPRVRMLTLLFAMHLVLLPVAAWLRDDPRSASYRDVRLACLLFEALAAIGMSGIVLFGVVLHRLHIHVPRILRDIALAVAAGVALLALASHAGFNLSGLIATSAVVTAVIGFSLQDTLGNVMGGLALQLDESFRVGDWIKVGDLSGRVTEIRWRYTAIETRNWETLIVPNSVITKGQIVVLGRRAGKPQQWRRWVYFNIDFRYTPSDVIQSVEETLQGRPIDRVSTDPPPNCILLDLQESTARYAVRYWLTDLAMDDFTDSVVRTRVWFALRRAGIPLSIPAHALFVTEESRTRREEKEQKDRARALGALQRIELFRELTDEDRGELAEGLRYAPFVRGEIVTRQGAEAHWLYIIVDGEVLVRVSEGGQEREVARLRDGQFFGEMSLMTGSPRSATVVAVTDVECYRLDKSVFQTLLRRRPELAEHVAATLAERRVRLEAVAKDLDDAAHASTVAVAKSDLLARIRDFFGLAHDHSGSAS